MAGSFEFSGKFLSKKGSNVEVTLNILQFKDTGSYVVYAPALEVYGYGKTIQEAKKSFVICLEEFLDYKMSKRTFSSELKRLGWKIKGSKNKRSYKIPDFSELLTKNERLISIMNEREVRTYTANIPMAIPA